MGAYFGQRPAVARARPTSFREQINRRQVSIHSPVDVPTRVEYRRRQPQPSALDQYTQFVLIGNGTFSQVYSAVRQNDGEAVAIKMIQKGDLKHMLMELSTFAILSQLPNSEHHFVRCHDMFSTPGSLHIVMELGVCDLHSAVATLEAWKRIDVIHCALHQLAAGLKTMHSTGLMHRDLKCGNVIIFRCGAQYALKLTDFGLAKIADSTARRGTPCGSPGYIAPEVLTGVAYSTAADIYSLGAILYFMTNKEHPPLLMAINSYGYPCLEPAVHAGMSTGNRLNILYIQRLMQLSPTVREEALCALVNYSGACRASSQPSLFVNTPLCASIFDDGHQ